MGANTFVEVLLGDIADFRNGKAISTDKYTPNGKHPVFGSNGQIAYSNEVLYAFSVIVIGRVGAYCGSVHYVPNASWVTDNAIVALPKDSSDVRYLFYLLGSLELQRTAIGSAQPLMTQGGLKVIRTRIPPLPTQRRIADILGTLDDKIELNRRMNATLEDMARTLFKSWFVDFDPVRAKMEGRRPEGMDAETAVLFPYSFNESELGPIPHGWHPARLDEIANIASGKRPEGRSDVKSLEFDIPIYGGGGRMGYVKSAYYEKPILITGRVGTLGLIFRTSEPSWPSDNTLVIEPKTGFFDFTYFVLKGFDLLTLNRGLTQPLLTQTDLKRQVLVLPNNEIVEAFERISTPIFRQIVCNERESRTLSTLRDTLLPKLMGGEIIFSES